jgi:hypothetical protein
MIRLLSEATPEWNLSGGLDRSALRPEMIQAAASATGGTGGLSTNPFNIYGNY